MSSTVYQVPVVPDRNIIALHHNHLCIHHESSLHIQTEKVASGINLAMYGKNRQNTEENKQVGQNHKTLKTITDQRPFVVSGGFTR